MGKPRLIILVRHAQSEGNKNREIHQKVPDHRVKLTPEGWSQAHEAGRKLRSLLRPDDTLHFFTSPYRRTRETTEGILDSLTSSKPSPSPFPRHTIKVYEEPRIREQDFGNFQPSSAEMARMWQERADYGHFFYRIPNGESAADAYDRVSGFNESLWRSFGEQDFASVCVLVTHGLMTRVFLMKWYHFSVEYFEDLRNVNHCEFVVMKLNSDNGKYILQNQLRTWSELKRERKASKSIAEPESPIPVRKRWGGCHEEHDGTTGSSSVENEDRLWRARAQQRKNTADLFMDEQLFGRESEALKSNKDKVTDHSSTTTPRSVPQGSSSLQNEVSRRTSKEDTSVSPHSRAMPPPRAQGKASPDQLTTFPSPPPLSIQPPIPPAKSPKRPSSMHIPNNHEDTNPPNGRAEATSNSGIHTPKTSTSHSGSSDSEAEAKEHIRNLPVRSSMALALNGQLMNGVGGLNGGSEDRVRADALGDQSDVEDDDEEEERRNDEDVIEMQRKREVEVDGIVR